MVLFQAIANKLKVGLPCYLMRKCSCKSIANYIYFHLSSYAFQSIVEFILATINCPLF